MQQSISPKANSVRKPSNSHANKRSAARYPERPIGNFHLAVLLHGKTSRAQAGLFNFQCNLPLNHHPRGLPFSASPFFLPPEAGVRSDSASSSSWPLRLYCLPRARSDLFSLRLSLNPFSRARLLNSPARGSPAPPRPLFSGPPDAFGNLRHRRDSAARIGIKALAINSPAWVAGNFCLPGISRIFPGRPPRRVCDRADITCFSFARSFRRRCRARSANESELKC